LKLHIPEIGDRFTLTKDWTFTVYMESRNDKLTQRLKCYKHMRDSRGYWKDPDEAAQFFDVEPGRRFLSVYSGHALKEKFTIVAGTEIKIDRIYIRKGAKNYSSVTVYATLPPVKPAPRGRVAKPEKVRFWVKLADFNQIEADLIELPRVHP
jgi:hypothetical protein